MKKGTIQLPVSLLDYNNWLTFKNQTNDILSIGQYKIKSTATVTDLTTENNKLFLSF